MLMVHKFPLVKGLNTVQTPGLVGGGGFFVDRDQDGLAIWASLHTESPLRATGFYVVETGEEIPYEERRTRYMGTSVTPDGANALHVFMLRED